MSRVIKYRVWITPWGNSEPYMHYIPDLHLNIFFGNWERGGYKNAVFQEFTGLFDRNNKEIYEGDFVKAGAVKEVINFSEGAFFVGDELLFSANVLLAGDLRVIGNIYENSELLK